jgi:hypothetical protein
LTPALTDELRAVLVKWQVELFTSRPQQAASGWIFPSRPGKPHHNSSCMRKAFLDCLQEIGVNRRFSSHGLRRTANDLIRRVASGEVARAITGHVTVAMPDHYAHVDTTEKRAAVDGMLRLIQAGEGERRAESAGTEARRELPDNSQEHPRNKVRNIAPENRNILGDEAEAEKEKGPVSSKEPGPFSEREKGLEPSTSTLARG